MPSFSRSSRTFRGLKSILGLPVRAGWGAVRLARKFSRSLRGLAALWWQSRRGRSFLAGLPALLVALTAVYLTAAADVTGAATAQAYLQAAREAMQQQSYEAARLYFEKSLQLQKGDSGTLFDLAQAAQKAEDYPRMVAILQQLAPEDRPVYAPAHLWYATSYFSKPSPSRGDFRIAERHLQHALRLQPRTAHAHLLLGELYFAQGLHRQAIRHLDSVVLERPTSRLMLAKAHALSGDEAAGRRWGESALDYYARRAANAPDNVSDRIGWADALMFLERYAESVDVLNEGLKRENDETLRMGLARVLAAWSDSLDQTLAGGRKKAFELLSAALLTNPNELIVIDRLNRLLLKDGELVPAAKELLLENVTEGRAVAMSHLILGVLAFEGAEADAARIHLEMAYEQLPNAPIIINNLAWYAAHSGGADKERALEMMNELIERDPQEPRFRDTRGFLLVKLGRWREGIHDLEQALPTHQKHAATHEALAEAYHQLGLTDLAKRHQAIADQL